MALLADELLFEAGLLDVTSTGDTGTELWLPPDQIAHDDIARRRATAEKDAPFEVLIGIQDARGVPADPAEAMRVIAGPVQQAFVAEFHTVLERTGLLDVPWVTLGLPPPEVMARAADLGRRIDQQEQWDRERPRVAEAKYVDDRIWKGLNRDIAMSALLGVAAQMDGLRRPLLACKQTRSRLEEQTGQLPGTAALRLWAPNAARVPWKDIIALHDHPARDAFRARLEDAEASVADLDSHEQAVELLRIGFRELLDRVRQLRPRGEEVAAELATDAVIDVLPFGGTLAALVRGVAELRREESEWTTVLLALSDVPEPAR